MIIEHLMDIFFNFLINFINNMDVVEASAVLFDFDSTFNTEFLKLLGGINYFIPLPALVPILVCESTLLGFKVIMASWRLIKSFIPTMGGM